MGLFAVAIFGPTGIGKTSLSLRIAKNIGEIISVDSMQVYRYMNIGTAKASRDEQSQIKHHLIDIISPEQQFTAGDFKRFCECEIPLIHSRRKIPFLVGGTGFYFSTLMRGIVNIPKIDEAVRDRVRFLGEKRDQPYLYKMLERVDPVITDRIHPNDNQRTLRAIEVFFGTGRKLSDYYNDERVAADIDYLKIGINCDRSYLYDRINNRVDKMVSSGLIDEVISLRKMGFDRGTPGMAAIGYKEILDYLDGNLSLQQAVDDIKKNSRHYAKRQLTWFRSLDDVCWFAPDEDDKITETVMKYISGKKYGLCDSNG